MLRFEWSTDLQRACSQGEPREQAMHQAGGPVAETEATWDTSHPPQATQVCPQGLGHFITCSRGSQQEVSRLRKGFSLDYWKAWKARDHRVALHKECNKEHPEKQLDGFT